MGVKLARIKLVTFIIIQAHNLCYDRDIGVKCISAAGDVFSPDGVLSGGRAQTFFVLKEIAQVESIKRKRRELAAENEKLQRELKQLEANQAFVDKNPWL